MLSAYRWQYIKSGVQDRRFLEVLGSMINAEQGARLTLHLRRSSALSYDLHARTPPPNPDVGELPLVPVMHIWS